MAAPMVGLRMSPPTAIVLKVKLLLASAILIGISIPFFLLLHNNEPPPSESIKASKLVFNSKTADAPSFKSNKKVKLEATAKIEEICGRVIARKSKEGAPGARVKIHFLPHSRVYPPFETNTDVNGAFNLKFSIPHMQKVNAFHITITAKGFLDIYTSFPRLKDLTTHDCGAYFLEENKEYLIPVRDESNEPVIGAQFEFYKNNLGLVMKKQSDSQGNLHITTQELGWEPAQCYISVRVRAPGMADLLISHLFKGDLPKKIILKPAGHVKTKVIDSKAGKGIPFAKVTLISNYQNSEFGKLTQISLEGDLSGDVKIPKIYNLEREFPEVYVFADGYKQTKRYWFSMDKFPDTFTVEPIIKYVPVRIVDKITQKPLATIPVKNYLSPIFPKETVTDEYGHFKLPVTDGEKASFVIRTFGYEQFSGFYKDDEGMRIRCLRKSRKLWKPLFAGGIYQIELPPRDGERMKVQVTVFDELKHPVAGAKVRIGFPVKRGNFHGDSITNLKGRIRREDFNAKPMVKCFLRVIREGYAPHQSSFIFNPTQDWTKMEVMLKRGIRFDRIRIEDKDGDNLQNARVHAELVMEDGNSLLLKETSRADGSCVFNFPFFSHGELRAASELRDMPEIRKKITFSDILNQEEIVLNTNRGDAMSSYIQGKVFDSEGKPMKGVLIRPSVLSRRHNRALGIIRALSDEKGFFRIKLYKDQLYNLNVSCYRNNNYWRPKDELTSIASGSKLEVLMVKKAIIEVDLASLIRPNISEQISQIFLMNDNDDPVRSMGQIGPIFDNKNYILFLDVPVGKMQVVVETKLGEEFLSPFFEVREGEHVKVKVEVN